MKGERLKRLVREEVKVLQAYKVEKSPYKAKLDANESPFSLPPPLHAELLTILEGIALNRYPDPDAEELRAAIAMRLGVPVECLILGNGSD
ncbi:MAG: histidinol-phosphate aminotransferase, partial [candidate division NC10 bacterium]|nr:histidinol-phosphate aminotransferase [candidate division NC10 bacterium]